MRMPGYFFRFRVIVNISTLCTDFSIGSTLTVLSLVSMFCASVTPISTYVYERIMDPVLVTSVFFLSLFIAIVTIYVKGCGWLKKWARAVSGKRIPSYDEENSNLLDAEILKLRRELDRAIQDRDIAEQNYNAYYNTVTQDLQDAKAKMEKMENERDDALRRLSELMSSRLRENNPNIVDLSDQFRPTKLAEISSELYDNEWTNAVEVLERKGASETEGIKILLDIVMNVYLLCKDMTEKQWKQVIDVIGDDPDNPLRQGCIDKRKETIGKQIQTSQAEVANTLKSCVQKEQLGSLLSTAGPVRVYLDACVRLCLYMAVQDPPVVWYCPGWTSTHFAMEQSLVGDNGWCHIDRQFETALFKSYMKSGNFVEFIVWPAMLLHTEGAILCKGVAQGYSDPAN